MAQAHYRISAGSVPAVFADVVGIVEVQRSSFNPHSANLYSELIWYGSVGIISVPQQIVALCWVYYCELGDSPYSTLFGIIQQGITRHNQGLLADGCRHCISLLVLPDFY